jgi:hypothetical protein
MIRVPLPQGQFAVIDDEMTHLQKLKWSLSTDGYAVRKQPFIRGYRKQLYLHHVVIGYPLKGYQVDHINGDRLDNRRANLRFVTKRQNCQNQQCHREGRLAGASRENRPNGRWRSLIYVNGKQIYLGSFDTAQAAHERYLTEVESLQPSEAASR